MRPNSASAMFGKMKATYLSTKPPIDLFMSEWLLGKPMDQVDLVIQF